VRVPSNFIEDTVEIFKLEPAVGCVVHATNLFQKVGPLSYVIPEKKFTQGWDFTIRDEAYSLIPGEFGMFGGDHYIFNHLHRDGWKVAVALSSPIIHYYARSRMFTERDGAAEKCF
jgi:hypothetical protein